MGFLLLFPLPPSPPFLCIANQPFFLNRKRLKYQSEKYPQPLKGEVDSFMAKLETEYFTFFSHERDVFVCRAPGNQREKEGGGRWRGREG